MPRSHYSSVVDLHASDTQGAFHAASPYASQVEHDLQHSEDAHNTESGRFVRPLVFGGIDGIVTTFAIVASSIGGGLAVGYVFVLGITSIVANALSMGFGEFLSSKTEYNHAVKSKFQCQKSVRSNPESSRTALEQLYCSRELPSDDAATIARLVGSNAELTTMVLLAERDGIMPPDDTDSSMINGLVMFFSFVCSGTLPMLPFLVATIINPRAPVSWILLGCAAPIFVLTLFLLGTTKSRYTVHHWSRSGIEMVLVGAVTSVSAYGIGLGISYVLKAV